MKTSILRVAALLLVMIMVLAACAPVAGGNGDVTTGADATTESVAGETTGEAETDAATTGAATTEATDATTVGATTEEPTTELPTTDAATTEEATTDEATTDTSSTRPVVKKDLKILMLGNSFCYYFVEELYAIAAADGYELTVANLYESGCSVREHWMNGVSNKEAYYELYVTTKNGRQKIHGSTNKTTIEAALAYDNWDVISLQQHFYPDMAKNYNTCVSETKLYAKQLYNYIRKQNPTADLYWHETWAYQVGYPVNAGTDTPIPDVETQTLTYNNIKKACDLIAQDNGVKLIPAGDAWQIARADSRVGDVMCARLGANGDKGDYYHDGDIGGGQYLNACVWYEVLTGESCIGNTWRPSYTLSEERIAGLQEAAHAAVAEVYGADHAK